jgi:hypothetical protein
LLIFLHFRGDPVKIFDGEPFDPLAFYQDISSLVL